MSVTNPTGGTALSGDPGQESCGLMPGYGTRSFYGGALDDERGRVSFVREVVSQVRRCPEYARYRSYLLENLDMGGCSVLSGLSQEELESAELELHHHPLSLHDVVETVLGQMEADGARVTTMAVAHRAMAFHWRGAVGLVPLVKTVHELVHAGQFRIDPRMVYGDWRVLLAECRAGIPEAVADRLRMEVASWGTPASAELNARTMALAPQRWIESPPSREDLLSGPAAGGEDDGDAETVLEG
jgi:hypothetical protein